MIKDVKAWLKARKPQFKVHNSNEVSRLKDGIIFSRTHCSDIIYRGYPCKILKFLDDCVHVKIEVQKRDGWFDDEVPINDVIPDFMRDMNADAELDAKDGTNLIAAEIDKEIIQKLLREEWKNNLK